MLKIINNRLFLIRCFNRIFLWKIDYVSWKASPVSHADIAFDEYSIFIDELNDHRFLLYDEFSFIIGSVVDDKIVFSKPREFNWQPLLSTKFSGNKLINLRCLSRQNDEDVPLWQFCEFDLERLTEKTVDIPLILSDDRHIPENPVSL
jgi:hypothetical protein